MTTNTPGREAIARVIEEAAKICDMVAINAGRRASGHTDAIAIAAALDKRESAEYCASNIREKKERLIALLPATADTGVPEITLKPGWLARDVARASARVDELEGRSATANVEPRPAPEVPPIIGDKG